MTNILILSCGTRNKIVQYFRRALGETGRVIATDCSPYAPALYEADAHYIVPRMTAPGYLDGILELCRREKIDGVLSLIDPELSLIAGAADRFAAVGTTVIGSSAALCDRSLDKWAMAQWLTENGFDTAKTYRDLGAFERDLNEGKIGFPVFVKPRFGSASLHIARADDIDTARFLFSHGSDMLVQEFLAGQEIGADCYIDMISGEVVSIFTKKKLVMRAGETDKAVSFKDEALFRLIGDFVRRSGFRGQIDIDLFDVGGRTVISEVNPRFGGGYPHAYECGADHMRLIVNNLRGIANEPDIGRYDAGVVMMKYNEIKLVHE